MQSVAKVTIAAIWHIMVSRKSCHDCNARSTSYFHTIKTKSTHMSECSKVLLSERAGKIKIPLDLRVIAPRLLRCPIFFVRFALRRSTAAPKTARFICRWQRFAVFAQRARSSCSRREKHSFGSCCTTINKKALTQVSEVEYRFWHGQKK